TRVSWSTTRMPWGEASWMACSTERSKIGSTGPLPLSARRPASASCAGFSGRSARRGAVAARRRRRRRVQSDVRFMNAFRWTPTGRAGPKSRPCIRRRARCGSLRSDIGNLRARRMRRRPVRAGGGGGVDFLTRRVPARAGARALRTGAGGAARLQALEVRDHAPARGLVGQLAVRRAHVVHHVARAAGGGGGGGHG